MTGGANGEAATGDGPGDSSGEKRWLSYAELAEALGIKRASAKRIAMRHRWQRQPGNDATARVAVPVTVLADSRRPVAGDSEKRSPGDRGASPDDKSLSVTMLARAVEALREAKDGEIATLHGVIEGLRDNVARSAVLLDLERARADRAEAGRDASEAERRIAEAARDEERARADAQRDRLVVLQAELVAKGAEAAAAQEQARSAQQRAEAMGRADDARRALGRWARLRRAWRGE